MRLILVTCATMLAFAANSVLNRMALAGGGIDAVAFGSVRLVAGAAMLAALCWLTRGKLRLWGQGRIVGVTALFVYIYGFSAAYEVLDAGLGALILFGMVQVTMFASAVYGREAVPPARWVGAALALIGLAWLLWPSGALRISLWHGGLMALAGIGWGFYSLAGRRAGDALQDTAANFAIAAVLGLIPGFWTGHVAGGAAGMHGIVLAMICGAITSGLGYAMWYSVLPHLKATVAAVTQLCVPVIAMAAGIILLGEIVTWRFAGAAALVLGGVAVSLIPQRDNNC